MDVPFMTAIPQIFVIAAMAFLVTACDSPDKETAVVEARLGALEKEHSQTLRHQRALELELEEQKIAADRDVLERDRMDLDEFRRAFVANGGASAEESDGLAEREAELGERDFVLEGRQNDHFERSYAYRSKPLDLNEEDLALAGRLVGGGGGVAAEAGSDLVEADFYEALTPYGSWFESQEYGYVWQPVVSQRPDWRPYSRGRWSCSDRGWTWISNEPFGWATYHYGRWAYLGNGPGWIWVPGTEWAPSWCTWRENGSEIGWAPLPPATLGRHGRKCDPSSDDLPGVVPACYTFVKCEHFDRPITQVCRPLRENATSLRGSRNLTRIGRVGGRVFSGGPGYLDLSEKAGRRLPYHRINNDKSPSLRPRTRIQGDEIVITLPKITREADMLSRPSGVRGSLENERRSDPRAVPSRERPSQVPAGEVDVELASRIAQVLMPDLQVNAWNVGFPTAEMTRQEIVLPELQTAALKPKEEEMIAETETGEAADQTEQPKRSDESKEAPLMEAEAEAVQTEPARTERPAPRAEPVREREPKEREQERDDEDRRSTGRGNR